MEPEIRGTRRPGYGAAFPGSGAQGRKQTPDGLLQDHGTGLPGRQRHFFGSAGLVGDFLYGDKPVAEEYDDTEGIFETHPRGALGFSGGVDSAYLLWAAKDAGAEVRPYFVKTPFQPEFELEDALRLGRELDIPITVIPLELPQGVLENPKDRCYFCKKALFGALRDRAMADGYDLLLDGTNASDEPSERPGMRALGEMAVLSPLRLCGLHKAEIRERSRAAGLFTWDKPAYACLATRFPAGTEITKELLSHVEAAEQYLASLGFSDHRVRVYHGAARIQVPEGQMERLLRHRTEILETLRTDFTGVLLDLEGRP